MAADVLMGNDQDASRWIRAHRDAAGAGRTTVAPAIPVGASARGRQPDAAEAGATSGLSVIEGGSNAGRPAGNRPRINRRALAAAAAMRDAAGGGTPRS
jgi:hypothetical protein